MKKHILTRGAVVVALALTVSACDQGLTAINQNPNSPTDVAAEYILPTVLDRVVGFIAMPFGTDWDDWAQQTAQIQYPAETVGEVRAGTTNTNWNDLYASDLKNIETIIQKGKDQGHANIQAVGMIWRAFTFSQMTDQWGDIPYTEALSGSSNITPKYDTQQDIYAGMLKTLTTAGGMLGATDPGDDFGNGDLFYGNNWNEWKKFANSLRMRLAMRLSEIDPATAKSEFVAAYQAGPFTSNADNAQLDWAGGNNYGNPWWENCICGNGGRDDNGVSKTLVDTLLSLNDPRLKFYAEPTTNTAGAMDGTFDGQPYLGRTNGKVPEDHPYGYYSRIGNYWRADGQFTPSIVMDYSEVLFLEAEAAWRGWISGDPGTLYKEAIQAAMDMYTSTGYATAPTAAETAAYLQNPRVVYQGGQAGFDQIQLQKWISLYMVGMEAWSNWRRVRIPHLVPGPSLAAGIGGITIIPVREPYPSGEQSLNNSNLQAAVSAQGGGLSLVTNMWWDVNTN
jgi:hypothetical protein